MEESLTRERLGPHGEGVDVFCSRRYGGAEAVETPGDGQRLITFLFFAIFCLCRLVSSAGAVNMGAYLNHC